MATLRFGTPRPGDTEQVSVQSVWGSRAAPQPNEWRTFFPYAMTISATAHAATFRIVGGTGTESYELNTADRIQTALNHPDSGIMRNGMNSVAFFNARSTFESWANALDGTRMRLIQGFHQDLEGTNWMSLSDGVATQSTLDAILTPALALYTNHPSVIGYVFEDDLSANTTTAHRAGEAMLRIPQLDVAGRPASPSILSGDTLIDPAAMRGILLFGASHYAVRWASTGVRKTEGDFTITGGSDWQSYPRAWALLYPNAHIWWWLQAHQLGDGSVPTQHLAYPTAREIRKMVWEAIGSGVKGIFWFIDQDMPELPSIGLANPGSRDRLDAVAEMGARITPAIRQRLLRSAPSATNTEFTASGGGSGGAWAFANFANAYISTLHDATSDTWYVVVCNRGLTTANVTINSATLSGTLVNLETGASIAVGGSVSLPPLDGTIFRLVPPGSGAIGVPGYVMNSSWTAEEAWAQHWTNPLSPNYVGVGDIVTHANTVIVGPTDNLQAVVDAAPNNTTFVLAANGVYDGITIVGRSGLHFVAADVTQRPTMRGVLVLGHVDLTDPTNLYPAPAQSGGYTKWVNQIIALNASAISTLRNPPRDIFFRSIVFRPVPGALTENSFHQSAYITSPVAGMISTGWPGLNSSPAIAAMQDVCFEGCDFLDWKYVNAAGDGASLPMPANHAGVLTATGGVYNLVARNCTFICGTYTNGQAAFQYATYLDGPRGCAFVDNVVAGFGTGMLLYLVNDDISPSDDTDQDGTAGFDDVMEIRNAIFNFVVGNSDMRCTIHGTRNVVANNSMTLAQSWSAASQQVVMFEPRCWKGGTPPSLPRMEYHNINNVVRDNTVTGLTITGSAAFVRHNAPNTACGAQTGGSIISGNVFTNRPVIKWYVDNSVDVNPSTATSNTDSNGTRSGA